MSDDREKVLMRECSQHKNQKWKFANFDASKAKEMEDSDNQNNLFISICIPIENPFNRLLVSKMFAIFFAGRLIATDIHSNSSTIQLIKRIISFWSKNSSQVPLIIENKTTNSSHYLFVVLFYCFPQKSFDSQNSSSNPSLT